MKHMYDAAVPQGSPPSSAFSVAAGYIGGDTPHVWTDEEWQRQGTRYRLPIFVRSFGGDPGADATTTLEWLQRHKVPKGCTVALDFETRVDSAYVAAYDKAMVGYPVMLYGSLSTVRHNPKPSGGYWVAVWDGVADLYAGAAAKQYMNHEPFDYSVIDDSVVLWDTQTSNVEEDMPDYTSVGRAAKETGSQLVTVHWDTTYEDTAGLRNPHSASPGLIEGGSKGRLFSATVEVVANASSMLAGVGTVRLVEVDPAKEYVVTKDYPKHSLNETFTVNGHVNAGMHLWVEVESASNIEVTGTAKVLSWAVG